MDLAMRGDTLGTVQAPLLNPGSMYTNFNHGDDMLCVIEVHDCNGESQDGMRVRASIDGTAYDVGAAFVLQPYVTWLVEM